MKIILLGDNNIQGVSKKLPELFTFYTDHLRFYCYHTGLLEPAKYTYKGSGIKFL